MRGTDTIRFFFSNSFLNESERNGHKSSCQIQSLPAKLHVVPDTTLPMWSNCNDKLQSSMCNNAIAVVKLTAGQTVESAGLRRITLGLPG